MKRSFCTITTKSHLKQTLALMESVSGYGADWDFLVLLTDGTAALPDKVGGIALRSILLEELQTDPFSKQLIKKYGVKSDELRWSLKPVLISRLLEEGADQVIYLDNDLYFYQDPTFLFETLNDSSVLLCPHWRIIDPNENKDWFYVNFTDGMYNAGFVGASKAGLAAMQWWAQACVFACKKDKRNGLWDDQKYLDLIPAEFENVQILNHRGCNVAFWNLHQLKGVDDKGNALVQERWPVVFLHITDKLVKLIKKGKVPQLKPYLDKYQNALK